MNRESITIGPIPDGYKEVTTGEVRPDDLIFAHGQWIEADTGSLWDTCPLVSDYLIVVRKNDPTV